MKGFFPDKSDHGAVTPFEYLPCGAITPKAGLALVLTTACSRLRPAPPRRPTSA